MASDDPLFSSLIPESLRDALRLSPDNAPLLMHAADIVLQRGGLSEAEQLYRRALAAEPASLPAKIGLASVFYQQGKASAALVIIESLTKAPAVHPRVLLMHAKLALQANEPELAAQQYLRAISGDPALADGGMEQDLEAYLPKRPAPTPPKAPPPAPVGVASEGQDDEAKDAAPGDDESAATERLPVGDMPGDAAFDVEKIDLSFADVGGMEKVKEEIRMKIILPLQKPELFRAYGKKVGGGILMYGPPGCGKTFLARATAGEVKANFLAVGINDVLDMWIGQSEKNLHAVFEQARTHRPCVLFFDEIDALGANRTDMLRSGGRQMINQFLSELDGVASSNEGVLILAATNAPWHLDAAFRRPGRFDRILFVPPPDLVARAEILRLLLRGKPVQEIDYEQVAKRTDGYSGADLKAVVELAVEQKLRAALASGTPEPVGAKDLLDAVKRHSPTVKDWFGTARNYALYANQSGLYDEILSFLKITK